MAEQVKKAFQGMLTQAETGYVPLSSTKGKACANCRWFLNGGCFIVESYEPEPILATGYCNRWEATPVPVQPEVEPIPVLVVEPPEMEYAMERKPKQSIVSRIKEMFTGNKDNPDFEVFKDDSGNWHWHATYTNNYEDLEQEIISEKAHDKFINRLDMGLVPMPELWVWHTFGTAHGKAKLVWRNDHFIHAVGDFDGSTEAKAAIEYYQKNKVKLSHGFTVPRWAFKDGVYEDYNTFEISTLPPKAAANPYTSFEELKTMAMTDEKRRQLKEVFKWSDEKIEQVAQMDENRAKALGELEVAYKDFADTTPEKLVSKAKEQDVSGVVYELMEAQDTGFGMLKNALSIIKAQKEANDKIVAEYDKRVKSQDEAIAELRKQLNMKPQRSSQADSTLDTEAGEAFKDKLPKDADAKTKQLQAMFGNAIKVGE